LWACNQPGHCSGEGNCCCDACKQVAVLCECSDGRRVPYQIVNYMASCKRCMEVRKGDGLRHTADQVPSTLDPPVGPAAARGGSNTERVRTRPRLGGPSGSGKPRNDVEGSGVPIRDELPH